MKKYLLCIIILSCTSCASKTSKPAGIGTGYEELSSTFDYQSGFGFYSDNHAYVFIPVLEETEDFFCHRYYLFKDGKLADKMASGKVYSEFSEIYKALIPLDEKLRRAGAKLKTIPSQDTACNVKTGTRKTEDSHKKFINDALTFIVYSPALIFAIPIGISTEIVNYQPERNFKKKLSQIKIGMTLDQVNSILEEDMKQVIFPPYLIQEAEMKGRRLIFAYKENILEAFIWGK